MATYYGVNKTKIRSGGIDNRLAKGVTDGRVKCFCETYEAGALASGSIIEMGPELPIGAVILEVVLSTDDLGGSATTLAVGDYEDNDRYITATNHGDGAVTTRLNAVGGLYYTVDATYTGTTVGSGSDRQITITTGADAMTGGTINLVVFYTQD
jgi:hypothetical protein